MLKRTRNPHTARQDAETWRTLYENSARDGEIKQIIIETLAAKIVRLSAATDHRPMQCDDCPQLTECTQYGCARKAVPPC